MPSALTDYYRAKEIYVKLPTQGRWYKQKLYLTDQGEIGVMPLSFKDEMLLQIPDSIYNGESLFEILKSIVPDFDDPYEICMPDVDVILLASRINNNKGNMEVAATCPHCNNRENYQVKIINILSKIKEITPIELELNSGLRIIFKPNTLKAVATNQIRITENARLVQQIANLDDLEKKHDIFRESLEKSTAANMIILADTISNVTTPKGDVITDVEEIIKWLSNVDAAVIRQIQKSSSQINANGLDNKFVFNCSNESCGEKFESSIEFNPTFFFINN